jgi:hypothetical protein
MMFINKTYNAFRRINRKTDKHCAKDLRNYLTLQHTMESTAYSLPRNTALHTQLVAIRLATDKLHNNISITPYNNGCLQITHE